MENYDIFTTNEYFEKLIEAIGNAKTGDRIRVSTMTFIPDDHWVRGVVDALCDAAERGADVTLMIDAHAFLISRAKAPGPLLYSRNFAAASLNLFKRRARALARLRQLGGRYIVTNMPDHLLSNPYKGRSHMKFAVINDYVMVGGVNLEIGERIDFMVGWNDKKMADYFDQLMEDIQAHRGNVTEAIEKDRELALNASTRLLIDAGHKDQSIIYDEALASIDAAKKRILFACQFFPNDVTLEHLVAAEKRGVHVQILFNHPDKQDTPLNLPHRYILMREKRKRPKSFFVNELPKSCAYLHAKLLITENVCMVGSHNYVKIGVSFGTPEIAIKSTDKVFASRLEDSLKEQLRENNVALKDAR